MDDKDLFEQLARGPLKHNGFDDNLRRRINGQLDNPHRSVRRPWFARRGALSASFLLIVAVIVAIWSWQSFSPEQSDKLSIPTEQASASAQASEERKVNPIPHSAVLIGLRSDYTQGGVPTSSYRTIMIAPENEQITLIGEGEGIWMPVNSNFWRVDAVQDFLGKGNQTIMATRADKQQTKLEQPIGKNPSLRQTEQLLYAGNQFVSILQTTHVNAEGQEIDQSQLWVNEVKDLGPAERLKDIDLLATTNFSLSAALKDNNTKIEVDQWAIARENHKWVAKQASKTVSVTNVSEIQALPTIPVALTKNIVKDDDLAISWNEVKSLEAKAIDAYTSQDEDIVAIVTDSNITLYPYRLENAESKKLPIQLAANESVVMVQWATQANYVDSWVKLFSKWFANSAN